MIECERPLAAGTPVELDLDESGTLGAEVRWCQQGQVGLHFAEAFALGKLARTRRPEEARAARVKTSRHPSEAAAPEPALRGRAGSRRFAETAQLE